MTGRQDDRKEYDRTKDRQRTVDEYMIDDTVHKTKISLSYSNKFERIFSCEGGDAQIDKYLNLSLCYAKQEYPGFRWQYWLFSMSRIFYTQRWPYMES